MPIRLCLIDPIGQPSHKLAPGVNIKNIYILILTKLAWGKYCQFLKCNFLNFCIFLVLTLVCTLE